MIFLNATRLMALSVSMIPVRMSEGERHYRNCLNNFGGKFIGEVFDQPPTFRWFGLTKSQFSHLLSSLRKSRAL